MYHIYFYTGMLLVQLQPRYLTNSRLFAEMRILIGQIHSLRPFSIILIEDVLRSKSNPAIKMVAKEGLNAALSVHWYRVFGYKHRRRGSWSLCSSFTIVDFVFLNSTWKDFPFFDLLSGHLSLQKTL